MFVACFKSISGFPIKCRGVCWCFYAFSIDKMYPNFRHALSMVCACLSSLLSQLYHWPVSTGFNPLSYIHPLILTFCVASASSWRCISWDFRTEASRGRGRATMVKVTEYSVGAPPSAGPRSSAEIAVLPGDQYGASTTRQMRVHI